MTDSINRFTTGIIPADAGSTIRVGGGHIARVDHPRGCGEHQAMPFDPSTQSGSSPRMRGALGLAHRLLPTSRIIPADAGSTLACPSAYVNAEDHPRGCGEHNGFQCILTNP